MPIAKKRTETAGLAAIEPPAETNPAGFAEAGARFEAEPTNRARIEADAASAKLIAAEPEPELASPADAAIDSMTATQQEALVSIETARSAMVEGIGRVQRELADFVSTRIRQDMETQQALLRCKTLEDVRGVQTAFFRTAMDQYSAEATRLMKLGGEIVARSLDRGAA